MAKKKRPAAPVLDLSDFVPLPEAAKLANVSERHMRYLVATSKAIPGVKAGRNYLVSASAAKAFERHPHLGRPKG